MPEKIVIKTKDQRRIDELEKENSEFKKQIEEVNNKNSLLESTLIEVILNVIP